MTFGEWLESERMTGNTDAEYLSAWLGWTAGQKAERGKYQELIAAAEAVVESWGNSELIELSEWEKPLFKLAALLERIKEHP